MKRRHFIRNSVSGLILPTVFHGFGVKSMGMNSLLSMLNMAGDTDLTLIMVYLSGGNDGLNTFIPLASIDTLNNIRSHVALKENQVLQLGNLDYALHPSMAGMKELFDEDRLCVIQNVGYPDQNYSHFRSTDIWMSGSDSDTQLHSGWTGRYLNNLHPDYPVGYPSDDNPHPLAIEIGYSSSLLFQSASQNMGYVIQNPDSFYEFLEGPSSESYDSRYGERLDYVRFIKDQAQQYGTVVKEAADMGNNMVEYPEENNLAQQLKICARLISGGMKTKMYLVELGGFDTHDNQVVNGDHTQGEHANLLATLSEAISVFMKDCDALDISDRVLGMTFSEFGRRIVSNASNGTDHGAAAPLFLFGNKVQGGVVGNSPVIDAAMDYKDNLAYEYDFRSIYSTIIERYFCDGGLAGESLYGEFQPLEVIKDTSCTTVSTENILHDKDVAIFPNPTGDIIHVEVELAKGDVTVDLLDVTGKRLLQLAQDYHKGGKYRLTDNLSSLPHGVYFIQVKNGLTPNIYKVIKQ